MALYIYIYSQRHGPSWSCKLHFALMGCTPRGRTATQHSKKGSEKVLGRVLGKGFSEEF